MAAEALDDWRGELGDSYTRRVQTTDARIADRQRLFARILHVIPPGMIKSVLEVGANVGMNLAALRKPPALLPGVKLIATEPNSTARQELGGLADEVTDDHAGNLNMPDASVDLVFTSGVLIHVPPGDALRDAVLEIHRVSARWVLCIEYFSAEPREVVYRDRPGRLWTRDFGQFYLDHCDDLVVVDYGFAWKPMTGLDNVHWWLFEKRP